MEKSRKIVLLNRTYPCGITIAILYVSATATEAAELQFLKGNHKNNR